MDQYVQGRRCAILEEKALMQLELAVRFVDHVTIIDMTGHLTLGERCSLFRETAKGLFEAGHTHVLLNLRGLTYIDSAGLGELTSCYITASRMGGKAGVVSARGKVEQVLQITHLSDLFVSFSDEDEAVGSFSRAGGGNF